MASHMVASVTSPFQTCADLRRSFLMQNRHNALRSDFLNCLLHQRIENRIEALGCKTRQAYRPFDRPFDRLKAGERGTTLCGYP